MKSVKVYIEGASKGKGKNQSGNISCRRAFSKLAERYGIRNRPEFVPCGGRESTWQTAWNCYLNRKQDECVMLLVDSEELLAPERLDPQQAWNHLRNRSSDKWLSLSEAHSRHVFLMVTTMETWLVADPKSLGCHFGSDFNLKAIPAWPALEEVEKPRPLEALEKATSTCSKPYTKGERSFEALAELDTKVITSKCPHAKYFFERLKEECDSV